MDTPKFKKNKEQKMDITIIKRLLIVGCICIMVTKSRAQRFALQPFVGCNYSFFSRVNEPSISFSEKSFTTRFNLGLLATYQITPKIGVELGVKRIPYVMSLSYYNPNTNQQSGHVESTSSMFSWQLGMTYCLYSNPKWLRLNALFGLEYLPNNYESKSSSRDDFYNDSTILVLGEGYATPIRQRTVFMNLGMGADFMIKQKHVGGLRLTSGIGFREEYRFEKQANVNGSMVKNQYSSNGSYVSLLMLVNISSIFGGAKK